ncbi:MAG: NifB/NifX family molybdenum-iron cluster-binding protein [Chloroflexota bacterium]|nr:NifB/NifX family molybdenum-iron cluster-binding protein [Chloroflexota bacterium]
MKIVVTSNGASLDAPASPVFGRCPTYIFVDTETIEFEAVENPAVAAAGGAGIQAAQFVIEHGAQAVVTGNVGPNASGVFQAANVPVYLFSGGTVQQAVDACKADRLSVIGGATVPEHAGMSQRAVRSAGTEMSDGVAVPTSGRAEEVAALKGMAGGLRKQLAEVMERLDQLEKGA